MKLIFLAFLFKSLRRTGRFFALVISPALILESGTAAESTSVNVTALLPTPSTPPLYTANRAPLVASPLLKLPIGSIKPQGWLRHQLVLESDGMTGHLEEISKWCKFENSAWATKDGQGEFGWEELPYWLKGYADLGYVLNDQAIISKARKWIDATLASQEPDGYFGPRANKTGLDGKPDLWPHMVMCNVLQSFYEFSGDPRVIPFLQKYLKFLNDQPGAVFGAGYWPKLRFGDTIETAYWLYNRTGEPWLLDLTKKIHDNMARWDSGVVNWHNVNIAQGFREPGVYYQQASDKKYLEAAERNYQTVLGRYGQFPGGGFGGDENCRPGYVDPRQGFETCGIVEFMHSFEMLTRISGQPLWADRCEELAFNSLPASMTPNLRGLHYLTCANQVQLDKNNKSPGIENSGTMFSHSPFEVYRCCQHNVSHGWPYYSEELWLATADRGLCASLYSASQVTANVGNGTEVRITEDTEYPFSPTIKFTLSVAKPVPFPLYLRVPFWCSGASVKVNGKKVSVKAQPLTYIALERVWKDKDTVTLELPMVLNVRTWTKNQNSISVDYGPLTFSLKIGERWTRYGTNEAWPEWEVFPTTAWNYGLVVDSEHPARSIKVVRRPGHLAEQPFTPESAPIMLQVKARKIPGWQMDNLGMVGKLQPSPVKTDQPVETVDLVPMGAARLRISSFPVIGTGPGSREWRPPASPPVSASHCNPGDMVDAITDGIEPKSSHDREVPRFTWWDHVGTTEWVQFDFGQKRSVSGVQVYWYDDTGSGKCRVPKSWGVLFRDGDQWREVAATAAGATQVDSYNLISFSPVQTTGLRLEAVLQPDFSAGILECKIQTDSN